MEISRVIHWLNREYGLDLSPAYYAYIARWESWWRGYYKPFHQYQELGMDGAPAPRRLYGLRMAKKVCEDWANLLLNDKLTAAVSHRASGEFLQGENMAGGLLGRLRFWPGANALVEKAFATGTGAMLLRLDGVSVQGDGSLRPSPAAGLHMDYVDAMHIVPLTVRNGEIVDCAFVSEELRMGKEYLYIETHVLGPGGYEIQNRYFRAENGELSPAPLPEGMAEAVHTGTDLPLFALLSPNLVNNIEGGSGLGMSVFADAEDALRGVDLAYNNFCRDFALGGKKVFFNDSMVLPDRQRGQRYTPDDLMQQLFYRVGEKLPSDQQMIVEHNPALRVAENREGLQAQLDYLSMKCGMGTRHYRFDEGGAITATQFVGSRQDLVQSARKHFILIEHALTSIFRAMLWAGKEILGAPVDPDTQVTINFDDGVVIDDETRRQLDLQEVREGILQKWEYRAKWYGEDEATARERAAGPPLEGAR